MLAFSYHQGRDFLAQHSAAGELAVLILSCVPALLGTKELWNKIKEEKRLKKVWPSTELVFLWILPVIIFLSTRATDWASDDTLRDVESKSSNDLATAQAQIFGLSNQLEETKGALAAAKIKPLKERLSEYLDSIDKRILPALREGQPFVSVNEPVKQYQYDTLQSLANEQGANRYIIFRPDNGGGMMIVQGIEGPAANLDIVVYPTLIK